MRLWSNLSCALGVNGFQMGVIGVEGDCGFPRSGDYITES